MKSGIDLLADYVFLSKYSQKKENGELESWDETVDRIYDMHRVKLNKLGLLNNEILEMLNKSSDLEKQKRILSSQRGRQFASSKETSGILKHEAKMYNCCSTYVDRLDAFGEIMYLLLCGCGVGYSLHKEFINKLPIVNENTGIELPIYTIEDSIEGWADSIKHLINNLFFGFEVNFDYSEIRPQGALIDGKFTAPGPKPLMKAHKNIRKVIEQAQGRKLRSIEIHDIICYIAESVVSGGVRRSAMIALFDKDDDEMLRAKTGNWMLENPQRAMANNSILIPNGNSLGYAELKSKISIIRQFGEPGFVHVPDYQYVVNPCGEIVMRPCIEDKTGFAFCNLVEINAERIKSKQDFYEACRISSFIATVQSLYTDFKYLSDVSKQIAVRDRAIGVSITGIYANPLLKDEVLRTGAKIVAETNAEYAEKFNINHSRTCTTIKPSGNASSILGLFCSGIHPAHAKKYLRRVRIKTYSPEYEALQNTPLVKKIDNNDAIISFPIETNNKDIIIKDDVTAVEHLKFISMVKHYWINKGSLTDGEVPNNVSATVEVSDDEWGEVAAVLFSNDYLFTGISLLPKYGDQIYENAPFQRLLTKELKEEYNEIKEFIERNDIDFLKIMSNRQNIFSGDLTAMGCSGGACELK